MAPYQQAATNQSLIALIIAHTKFIIIIMEYSKFKNNNASFIYVSTHPGQ